MRGIVVVHSLNHVVQAASCYIHVAGGVDGKVMRSLIRRAKGRSFLGPKEDAITVKSVSSNNTRAVNDHHLVVVAIRDVHVAEKVWRDTEGAIQLCSRRLTTDAGTALAGRSACACESFNDASSRIHDANLIGALVGDVDIAAHIQRNGCRKVQ